MNTFFWQKEGYGRSDNATRRFVSPSVEKIKANATRRFVSPSVEKIKALAVFNILVVLLGGYERDVVLFFGLPYGHIFFTSALKSPVWEPFSSLGS
jgi:hypothetical protein